MRVVIQRVKEASVIVEDKCIGHIGKGLLLFVGIGKLDTEAVVDKYTDKILKMRIFEDDQGKTNLSLADVCGEVLAISQFTLYADCKKGNRPNFLQAADPARAWELYHYFVKRCREKHGKAEEGSFGDDMKIHLINDGPFTIILDENTI